MYMHSQATLTSTHSDCSRKNLMMDAGAMYPDGFHPVKQHFLPDAVTPVWPLSRSKAGVKYYFVDFGISVQAASGQLVEGNLGRDRDPPELHTGKPYDPFKLDVWQLGTTFNDFKVCGFGVSHAITSQLTLCWLRVASLRSIPFSSR